MAAGYYRMRPTAYCNRSGIDPITLDTNLSGGRAVMSVEEARGLIEDLEKAIRECEERS